MKLCLICTAHQDDVAPTCLLCGEATFVQLEESAPIPVASADPVQAPPADPEPQSRRRR